MANIILLPLSLNDQSEMINLIFEKKLIWAPTTLEKGAIVVDSGTGSGKYKANQNTFGVLTSV
jgi:hypothetical protein